jgi:hypothetical protein
MRLYETYMRHYGMVWPLKYPPPQEITRHISIIFAILGFQPNPLQRILYLKLNRSFYVYKCYVSGHYPSSCLYLKKSPDYFSKHNVSETGFCLRLQVKPTQLSPIDRVSPYLRTSIDWAQLSRFYLKTETKSSFRKVWFWKIIRRFLDKDKTMDNVRKHNIRTSVRSSETVRSYYQSFHFSEKYMAHITDDAISCKARTTKTIL